MKEPELETISKDAKECSVCGRYVDKVFQQDACKDCLVKSFSKHIQMINEFRAGAVA